MDLHARASCILLRAAMADSSGPVLEAGTVAKIWQSPLWETPLCAFRFNRDIVDIFFHASRAAWLTRADKLPSHLQEGGKHGLEMHGNA